MSPIVRLRIPIVFVATIMLLSVLRAGAGDQTEMAPRWTVDLTEHWGLRPFRTDRRVPWTREQNVVFLTPQQVAVYQVNELRSPAALEQRDATGGGGNFFLEVRVFDVHDGHALESLHLRTSAELSRLLPTHDGKWIARTGDVMYVLSPTFQTLASRRLPLERVAPLELWQIDVAPSGSQAVLVHQQVFRMEDSALQRKESAKTDIELIDADTLKTIKTLALQHALHAWSATDGFLVTLDPAKSPQESRFGLLDFEGHWAVFQPDRENCRYEMGTLRPESIAAYGCGRLGVFLLSGQQLFALKVDGHEQIGSVERGEDFLAIEFDREVVRDFPDLNFSTHVPKPVRIEAYELKGKKQLLSLPVLGENVYFALSPQGALAVVDGGTLRVFQLTKQ